MSLHLRLFRCVSILAFKILPYVMYSQSVLIADKHNAIYRFDYTSCETTLLFSLNIPGQLADITYDKMGDLYGLTTDGKLYFIDTTSGKSTLLYSFLNLQSFRGMKFSVDGVLYVTGSEGFTYSLDLISLREKYLGDLGYEPTGAITFIDDTLWIFNTNRTVVKINYSDFSKNTLVVPGNYKILVQDLFYLPMGPDPCAGVQLIGLRPDSLLAIPFDGLNVPWECHLSKAAVGVASQYDFIQYSPPHIDSLFSSPANCNANNGSIRIHASGGMGALLYSLDRLSYTNSRAFNSLMPGQYIAYAKDGQNCVDSVSMKVKRADGPEITNLNISQPTCTELGQVGIITSSSTQDYSYSLDNAPPQSNADLLQVMPGHHLVRVSDSMGCFDSTSFNLDFPDPILRFSLKVKNATCHQDNASVEIRPEDLTASWSFSLDHTSPQFSTIFNDLKKGRHLLTVQSGFCTTDTAFTVTEETCEAFIPNVFTPNHDGKNDLFKIYYPGDAIVQVYQIYNRWGGLIFEAKDFSIDSASDWWDGTEHGTAIESGVYLYRIVLLVDGDQRRSYQNTITVLY